jgi:hypothetical protein
MARTGMPISEQMPLADVKNRLSEVVAAWNANTAAS